LSHDTFSEIYATIDTELFSNCFSPSVANLATTNEREIIAIDGKRLRHSHRQDVKKSRQLFRQRLGIAK
jgi:hypothetical protein